APTFAPEARLMAHIDSSLSTARRIYVRTKYGEPVVEALRALGAKWDAENKAWWVGAAKRARVEELLVAADKAEDDARDRGEPTPKESPDDIRLTGKGTYKGRS